MGFTGKAYIMCQGKNGICSMSLGCKIIERAVKRRGWYHRMSLGIKSRVLYAFHLQVIVSSNEGVT